MNRWKKFVSVKRFLSILLGIIILTTNLINVIVSAAEYDQQKPPEKLKVADNGIGANQYDGNYIDLEWEYPSGFIVSGSSSTYLNFYTHEIPKAYQSSAIKSELKEGNVRVNTIPTLSPVSQRLKKLKSGTVYYIDATAFYRYQVGDNTRQSSESQSSNRIKAMTEIDIRAYSLGINQIRIEWDDVWNSDGRIGYRLYVSDSEKFSNTPSKYIDPSSIGEGKSVEVNQATGKLAYTHTVSEPGKVYFVKIEPDIGDTELRFHPKSTKVVTVSSFILARTSKVSSSPEGSIWRLDWSQVYAGWSDRVDVKYEIYRGDIRSNELPGRIQTVNNTSIFVVLRPEEEAYVYYIIRAVVTRKDNGQPFYPGIKIESDKIVVKDYDVGAYPPMPEIVDELGGIKSESGHNSSKVLWKVPRKATGEVDTDTLYDVWLVTDPDILYDTAKLGVPVSWNPGEGTVTKTIGDITFRFDPVKNNSNNLLGYSCTITDIKQNSAYYFKIEARKSYLEHVGEEPAQVFYSSVPAFKVIITPADGEINQPVTPPKPPFKLKKTSAGSYMVTGTTAVVEIKNRWYEEYSLKENKWKYIKTEKDNILEPDPTYPITPEEILENRNQYRMITYDDKVKIDVYYVEYKEGMDYQNLYDESKYKPTKITGFSTIANDVNENPQLNYPDKRYKRNVDIEISGLKPNTTYVVWVKAVRQGAIPPASEPSDPIIVTTNPIDTHPVETPIVPSLFVNQVGDSFVDLIWDFKDEYNYYLDYGTSENMNPKSEGTKIDIEGQNFYRVGELDKDTIYYFRIKAEYVGPSGESKRSDWSNPVPAKTLADIPPGVPKGFGIKTSSSAITKNSITYEWMQEDGLEYILEVSDNPYFRESTEYNCGESSEYKADKLRSNYRYYARLYAYDASKKLRSEPTAVVSVITKRSTDDYDSNEDIEDIITGDFIERDSIIIDNTWNIRITGINADRFIEYIQKDRVLDYKIGLYDLPPKVNKIQIIIAEKVFNALTKLKENLIFATHEREFVIRPGMLNVESTAKDLGTNKSFNFEFKIELDKTVSSSDMINLKTASKMTGFEITARDSMNSLEIKALDKPLKVIHIYENANWYKEGVTSAFIYDKDTSRWIKTGINAKYDRDRKQGTLTFETGKTGDMIIAEPGTNLFDDIGNHWAKASIIRVASTRSLKSIGVRKFVPDRYITIGDAVKFILDVMEYNYSSDYMLIAARASIIPIADVQSSESICTREKLVAMTIKAYELMSGEKTDVSGVSLMQFDDMDKISRSVLPGIKAAYEKGIIISRFKGTFGPDDPVTRAETMVLLEKLLMYF